MNSNQKSKIKRKNWNKIQINKNYEKKNIEKLDIKKLYKRKIDEDKKKDKKNKIFLILGILLVIFYLL